MSLQSAATITEQGPAATAVSEVISIDPAAAASTVYAAVLADPTDVTPTTTERSLDERNIDINAPCAIQPDGYGPKPTDETVAGFLADPRYRVSLTFNAPLLFAHARTENCFGRRNSSKYSSGLQSRIREPEWLV